MLDYIQRGRLLASTGKVEINSPSTINTLTRREGLAYAQLAAFVLLLGAIAIILIYFALPRPQWVVLGSTDELTSDAPTRRSLTLPNGTDLTVWVVRTNDKWYVFAPQTPFGTHCTFQWQTVTQRFEDPCLAAKFTLTGEFIDQYTAFAGQTVRNLDRYEVSVRDAHVWIDASHLIRAEPFVAQALDAGPLVR